MEDPSRCSHTFSVPSYDLPGDDRSEGRRWMLTEDVPGVTDRVWSCAHDALPERDVCPFHCPPDERPPDLDETDAFRSCLARAATADDQRRSRRLCQFIDATFEELAFRGTTVGGEVNHAINLAHAEIGESDWTDATFRQPIRCSHATFTGPLTLRDARFERSGGFRNATFEGDVQLRGGVFAGPAVFKHADFRGDARLWYTQFEAHANFRRARFRDVAYFEAVDFTDYARFTRATFDGETTFKLAEFDDDADFDGARFRGDHGFRRASFDRITDFSDALVEGPLDLSTAEVATLELTPSAEAGDRREDAHTDEGSAETQCVNLREATVGSGTLGQPASGSVLYDCTDATLGDVSFTDPDGGPVCDRVRFARTRFEDFVFENDDLDPAAAGWRLSEVADPGALPEASRGAPDTETLRQTFLNAKNGADETGNNTAASAFFYRELTYRRRRYAELARDGTRRWRDRAADATKWGRNLALMLSTGYGERPDRVVYSSVTIIVFFALLYARFLSDVEYAPVDYVVFSFQSFITFILGTPPAGTARSVEVLSAVEGFVGAFFIALFVFTFTRRINR
ncbi:pentapeptide repeat-containing protein [Halorubrum ejinorense]|uniref:Pentapeptide repeat-containing protein n=2 Tax=Halorubrum ejinorense TaxID=425309 RepID=A0ABV4IL66_9EURY